MGTETAEKTKVKKEVQRWTLTPKIAKLLQTLMLNPRVALRYSLSKVCYNAEKGELVATNSKVLIHLQLARKLSLESGLYDLIETELITAPEDDLRFPSYNEFLPSAETKANGTIETIKWGIINIIAKHGVGIDIFEWDELIKAIDNFHPCDIAYYFTSPDRQITLKFIESDFTAHVVMMPFVLNGIKETDEE